jgi:YHS domain-containing protein
MIRFLLSLLVILLIYTALKTVVRSAVKGYREDDKGRSRRILGDEMVLDPECHTYVVKDRAVTRHIRGTLTHFCSDACARRYEDKNRS